MNTITSSLVSFRQHFQAMPTPVKLAISAVVAVGLLAIGLFVYFLTKFCKPEKKIIHYEEGQIELPKLNGEASYRTKAGRVYKGIFKNGVFQKGKITSFPSLQKETDPSKLTEIPSETCEGTFNDNGQLIKGIKTFANGTTENGDFVEDKFVKGTKTFPNPNGFSEFGDFTLDALVEGRRIFNNGNYEKGKFELLATEKGLLNCLVKGTRFQGKRFMGAEIGITEEGEFDHDRFSAGTRTFANGDYEKGKFELVANSKGTFNSLVDGTRFLRKNGYTEIGEFDNDGLFVKGRRTFLNDDYEEGSFENEVLIFGKRVSSNYKINEEGTFVNNHLVKGNRSNRIIENNPIIETGTFKFYAEKKDNPLCLIDGKRLTQSNDDKKLEIGEFDADKGLFKGEVFINGKLVQVYADIHD